VVVAIETSVGVEDEEEEEEEDGEKHILIFCLLEFWILGGGRKRWKVKVESEF
jgi:hypothetical protein